MKKCNNCRIIFEDDAGNKFCSICGAVLCDLPEENKQAEYSASIGDKNVISGDIIGKSEAYNITGKTTINKIEDDTKKFITCAVSGKHLLRGRDAVVNCPKCKSDVSLDCYTLLAGRCFNCDKAAYTQFSNQLDDILSDGIIDAAERIQLDALALSLMIDNSTKLKLETEAKERKANINLNAINANSTELSGFYKIQFKKAVTLLFEQNDLENAVNILKAVHLENIYHDETSSLYYLVKAIHSPNEFIDFYVKENGRQIDIYWEHFWAFIAYSELHKYDQAFKIINLNKARFSDNRNDILLSEVIAYLMQFFATKESEWLDEAKSVYQQFGRTIKQPLVAIHELINKLIITPATELEALSKDFSAHEKFYFDYVLGHKTNKNPFVGEKKIQSDKSENQNEVIDEHIEVAGIKNEITLADEFCREIIENLHQTQNELDAIIKKIDAEIGKGDFTADNVADSLSKYAEEFFLKGEFKESIKTSEIVFRLSKRGGALFHIAVCYEKQGELEESLKYYIESAEIRRERVGIEHELTLKSVTEAKRINDQLGQYDFDLPSWFDDAGEEWDWGLDDGDNDNDNDNDEKKENNELIIITDDEFINLSQTCENSYNLNFKAKFLKRIDFDFYISHEKIVINSKNVKFLIDKWARQLGIKHSEDKVWVDINQIETRYFNQDSVNKSLTINIPTLEGKIFPEWKKKLLLDEDDKDVTIIIERYISEELKFGFKIEIGKYYKKYRFNFGNYTFNKLD